MQLFLALEAKSYLLYIKFRVHINIETVIDKDSFFWCFENQTQLTIRPKVQGNTTVRISSCVWCIATTPVLIYIQPFEDQNPKNIIYCIRRSMHAFPIFMSKSQVEYLRTISILGLAVNNHPWFSSVIQETRNRITAAKGRPFQSQADKEIAHYYGLKTLGWR